MGEYRALYSNGVWGEFSAGKLKYAWKMAREDCPKGCTIKKVEKCSVEETKGVFVYKVVYTLSGVMLNKRGKYTGGSGSEGNHFEIEASNRYQAEYLAEQEIEAMRKRTANCRGKDFLPGKVTLEKIVKAGRPKKRLKFKHGGPEKFEWDL